MPMTYPRSNRCHSCPVRAAALCSAVGDSAAAALERIVHRVRVPEGNVVYGGPTTSRTFSIITSGVVKLVSTHLDGHRQIVSLQFPSAFVGRPFGELPSVTAEAATDVELCSCSGPAFEALLAQYPELERAVLQRILKDLDASREWLVLLGRRSAEDKVGALIAMIAERMSGASNVVTGASDGRYAFRLPLSRSEIADCLGLRLETVSRQIAQFKARGLIETKGRRALVVKDLEGLRRGSEGAGMAA